MTQKPKNGDTLSGHVAPENMTSPQLARLFPKLCKPRKRHMCRLCGKFIQIAEPCCSWSNLEEGEGWSTSYAHPECYQETLDSKWDDMDWECSAPGDLERPSLESSPQGERE